MAKKDIVKDIDMNSDMTKLVSKISVDLPSANELDYKLRRNVGVTDMARLTGVEPTYHTNPLYRYLLRDLNPENNCKYIYHLRTGETEMSQDFQIRYRAFRTAGIRPVLRFDDCPELFDILVSQFADDNDKIRLGMIAQNGVTEMIQDALESIFNRGEMIKTDLVSVFDDVDPFMGEKGYYQEFKPLVCNYYAYKGTGAKYIRWKVKNLSGDYGAIIRHHGSISIQDQLYKSGQYAWIEVRPVSYDIDREKKILVADKLLVGGIQFACAKNKTRDGMERPLNYEKSNVKHYLDTYMKPNLLRNVSKMLKDALEEARTYKKALDEYTKEVKKSSLEKHIDLPYDYNFEGHENTKKYYDLFITNNLGVDPDTVWKRLKLLSLPKEILDQIEDEKITKTIVSNEPTDDNSETKERSQTNERTKEIKAIRNDIRKFARYSLTDTNALEEADKLIREYNEKVLNSEERERALHLDISHPNTLYLNLKLDLNKILDELKENSIKVSAYFDMIDILTECKGDNIDEEYDDICKTVKKIKLIINSAILNSESKKELTDELNSIFDKHIKFSEDKINEYRSNPDILVNSIDELKYNFRKDERLFIFKLTRAVQSQNVVNEMNEIINSTIENQNEENKDKRILYFIRRIDAVTDKINSEGNYEDRKALKEIKDALQVDKTQSLKTVLENYTNMLTRAMSLELKIEERKQKKQNLSEMLIDIDDDEKAVGVNKR